MFNELFKQGKEVEAFAYLQQNLSFENPDNILPQSTHNKNVDLLLLYTSAECKNRNIEFRYTVGGNLSRFSNIEISVLLAHLLCNIMEIVTKKIYLQIIINKEELSILVENSLPDLVDQNIDYVSTIKQNIHNILLEYQGDYVGYVDDNKKLIQEITMLSI